MFLLYAKSVFIAGQNQIFNNRRDFFKIFTPPNPNLSVALLFRYADKEQFLSELKNYYLPMANLTGTLWEHDTDKRSCNHAFTSHLLCWLYALGMIKLNYKTESDI